jgi:hypothetical protein
MPTTTLLTDRTIGGYNRRGRYHNFTGELTMDVAHDLVLRELNEIVRADAVGATITEALHRVRQRLHATVAPMTWEVVPLDIFGVDFLRSSAPAGSS